MANFKDSGKSGLWWRLLVVIPMMAVVAIPPWIALKRFADTTPPMPASSPWRIVPGHGGAEEEAYMAAIKAEAAASHAVWTKLDEEIRLRSFIAIAMTIAAVLGGVWFIVWPVLSRGAREGRRREG
jgi:hypothetical protein